MTVDLEGFHGAHDDLREQTAELRRVARDLPRLPREEREREVNAISTFLRERVAPHTKLDERLLYPEVTRRTGDPFVAATMAYDHLAIRRWIEDIASCDVNDVDRLQELLYGLDALMRVHIWKENELFLTPLESPSWPAR